ncbi:hypothetical protein F4779DRAFT_530438 [Xylariaceae sp. FL0662B]|nr:hypothetical protein F4779DRAFT_530438 [Xylariaceae sp. FL0662B]
MPLKHDPTIISQETSSPLPTATLNPTASTLLTLPLELRLEILSYLLVLPPPATPGTSTPPARPHLHPAILRANRQLHAEAIPLLYRHNTFQAHTTLLTAFPRLRSSSSWAWEWPPVRAARVSSLITRVHVRVRLDAAPGYDRGAAARGLSGKDEVVLEAWQAVWRGAGPDVLRLFDAVRGVRSARVVGSVGGFEDYARWLQRAMMAAVGEHVEPFFWDRDRGCRGGAREEDEEDAWARIGGVREIGR